MAVPLTANLAVEGITNRPNPESRNARKQQPTTGFLAKSNTCSGQITAIVQSLPNSSRATIWKFVFVHDSTWTAAPVCYLEDLFVDPNYRNRGLGRLLIQDLVDLAEMRGWARLYWHTQATNPARRLYDEFAGADDFVRYRLIFSD
jgi:GNAT superfamily N-acetyltransferase